MKYHHVAILCYILVLSIAIIVQACDNNGVCNLSRIKAMQKGAARDLDAKDHNGDTRLIQAIRAANAPRVQWLLLEGANDSICDKWGKTPLHIARALPEEKPGKYDIIMRLAFSSPYSYPIAKKKLQRKNKNKSVNTQMLHESGVNSLPNYQDAHC